MGDGRNSHKDTVWNGYESKEHKSLSQRSLEGLRVALLVLKSPIPPSYFVS